MRRTPIALILTLIIGDAALSVAAADCTCRSQGRDYDLGKSVCLSTPKGARIATCGMVLNNTSWQFSETPCVVSEAPADVPPPNHSHDHVSHQHASHGG
jgi:hypothetical protein